MELMCFLFGHSQMPYYMQAFIEKALDDFYDLGFRIFVVGYHGDFDQVAAGALGKLKQKHPDVILFMLTPYHPQEREIDIPEDFDISFYPPGMETVPRKYCIVRANQYMIKHCEGIICYVKHPGNARDLFEKINRKKVLVRNVAWEDGYKEYPGYLYPEAEEIIRRLKPQTLKSPFV